VLTAVIRAEKSTLVGFDERVDAATFRRSDGNAYLAPDPLRKSLAPVLFGGLLVGEVFPGVAAVARHVQAAARPATGNRAPPTPRLPQPGEDNARVVRVQTDVGCTGVRVLVKDLLPRLAAVGRSEHAALRIRPERVSQGRRISNIRIGRMNRHRADLPFLLP